jgi:hypothetical protein
MQTASNTSMYSSTEWSQLLHFLIQLELPLRWLVHTLCSQWTQLTAWYERQSSAMYPNFELAWVAGLYSAVYADVKVVKQSSSSSFRCYSVLPNTHATVSLPLSMCVSSHQRACDVICIPHELVVNLQLSYSLYSALWSLRHMCLSCMSSRNSITASCWCAVYCVACITPCI